MSANGNGKMRNTKRKPYAERDDLEKIQSQWTKLSGLHDRTDWSAAVVRAATATELAVNLAVRREFASRSELDHVFVDSLLKWANGLSGKLDRLLLPLLSGREHYAAVNGLCSLARTINDARNGIVHRGEFCSEEETTALIADCKAFVHGIVQLYEPDFHLTNSKVATSR